MSEEDQEVLIRLNGVLAALAARQGGEVDIAFDELSAVVGLFLVASINPERRAFHLSLIRRPERLN